MQPCKVDLIYIVGGRSSDPTELKFSIRSMVKHLRNFGRLIIVGHCPDGVKPDLFFPYPDRSKYNPNRNIFEKIIHAAQQPVVTENFLVASDDHFLLEEFDASNFPCFNSGTLKHSWGLMNSQNPYQKDISNTIEACNALSLPAIDFNVHCPFQYSKPNLLALETAIASFWPKNSGLLTKSIYANYFGLSGPQIADCKIHAPKTPSGLKRSLSGRPWFSTSEAALNPSLIEFLNLAFPGASSYE